MQDNILIIVLLSINIILVIMIIIFLFLLKNNNKNDDTKISINRDFIGFSRNINENIKSLENNISSNLLENYKITNNAFNQINERIIKIDEAQHKLNDLSNEINSLQNILQDKKNRGTFGETELYSILESVLGINDLLWKKQYKLSNGKCVDAAILMNSQNLIIPVDSKFPLENFRRIYDLNLNENEREIARKNFKNDLLKHIDDISSKYILQAETTDLAYMFVPSEAIYSEIYSKYSDVVDISYKRKVFIVSPTTLLAYLTAIRSLYLGQKKNEKAIEIEKLLGELSIEFVRLKERSENLQRDYERIIPDFENMFITTNKIIKKFANINNGEFNDNESD